MFCDLSVVLFFWIGFCKAARLRIDLNAHLLMSRWFLSQEPVHTDNICQWSQTQLASRTSFVLQQMALCWTLICIKVKVHCLSRSKKKRWAWGWESWLVCVKLCIVAPKCIVTGSSQASDVWNKWWRRGGLPVFQGLNSPAEEMRPQLVLVCHW